MNANRIRLLSLTVFVIVSVRVAGQTYDLSWHTIDGGGVINSSDGQPNGIMLSGTIGQPDANGASFMIGGVFELTGGFWPMSNICYCPGDLNRDGQLNGRDVQKFVTCIVFGGDCTCADVDAVNGVTLNDVPVFVTDLLAGGNCP